MDALILSCGTGGGHNSAGFAVEEELKRRGHNVTTLNPFTLADGGISAVIDNTYISIAKNFPHLFGLIYNLGAGFSRLPIPSPVYLMNSRMSDLMEQYFRENSYDIVVMSHLFPAEILTNMKRRGMEVPITVFISTDYTCIPFTEEIDCDLYVIPADDLADEYIRRGVPTEKIYPLGIPVKHAFSSGEERESVRKRLGLDAGRRYILVSGGSMGAGRLELVVDILRRHYGDKNVTLIIVCGSNRRLYEKLSETCGHDHIVLEHTDRMADYMLACDIFITKPGGLSSTEAAVSGTPVIHITPIPGCETYNMRFFESHGMSIAVPSPKRQLISACNTLDDDYAREKMVEDQHRFIHRDASFEICDLIEGVVHDAHVSA